MLKNSVEKDNNEKKYGANIHLIGHGCYRCGHEWLPIDKHKLPKVCPKCKSPYWDTPKKEAHTE